MAIISCAVDFIENVSMGIKLNHIWSTFGAQKILPKLTHFVANGRQNSLNRRPISLVHEFCLYSGMALSLFGMPTTFYIPPFSRVFVAPRPSIDVYDTILDSSAQKELQFFGYIGVGAF